MTDTLAIILGGGQGSRLFPLTATRSKPAVPIGGKYRLIDIPISGCLHADIHRIFVLTQFNSASLNRHISNTYRLDRFSGGFVEILAAEQTPDNPNWYQGTADAVRQAARHFVQHDAKYDLILAGDHLYRMDYEELVEAHRHQKADITIAAQPVDIETATQMGIFRFDREGTIIAFEEMASMGVYVFSRRVLINMLERESGHDFGRELIPGAIGKCKVKSYQYRGYWADVGTIESFYQNNVMLGRLDSPFHFWDKDRPIYTHLRHLPGSLIPNVHARDSLISEGCYLAGCAIDASVVGVRAAVREGTRISRSVLLGADFYEYGDPPQGLPALGIGKDVVLDRVIIDKNARIGDGARLVNENGVEHADGDGYYIRGGIIVVAKGGVIKPGTVV
jgi:glucose-1-phosphate adenylyltransferase